LLILLQHSLPPPAYQKSLTLMSKHTLGCRQHLSSPTDGNVD